MEYIFINNLQTNYSDLFEIKIGKEIILKYLYIKSMEASNLLTLITIEARKIYGYYLNF